ncbi:MFS transporter [Caulobacter sp.]|uniref:MFS transporter n=1 Tax=Caulobacter sp. TaxID=78 RepID=UPI0031E4875D
MAAPIRPAYAVYGLVVLIVAYVLAFIDRQVLNLLVEPLKRDLGLSDLQVSLLQGPAFGFCLALAGLPIGRLVDTRRRVSVLCIGVAIWSLMAAGCGLAPGYAMLLACRIGVGAGEATMAPSAYSLIGDWFSPRRQGVAAGFYSMGAYVGGGLALILGGALLKHLPASQALPAWRLAFLATAAAGIPVALWVAALREPPRREAEPTKTAPSWRQARAWFAGAGGKGALAVNAAVTFAAMASYSISAWTPSALIRTFHLAPHAVGLGVGLTVITAGVAGSLSAGFVGDALRARGLRDGRLWTLGLAALLAIPLAASATRAASPDLTFILLWPLIFLVTMAVGSGPASLQEITPARMRGLQHALAVLAVNLIGLGLGPPIVAAITDIVFRQEARVGQALALAAPVMLALSATCALFGRAAYRRALPADV